MRGHAEGTAVLGPELTHVKCKPIESRPKCGLSHQSSLATLRISLTRRTGESSAWRERSTRSAETASALATKYLRASTPDAALGKSG